MITEGEKKGGGEEVQSRNAQSKTGNRPRLTAANSEGQTEQTQENKEDS